MQLWTRGFATLRGRCYRRVVQRLPVPESRTTFCSPIQSAREKPLRLRREIRPSGGLRLYLLAATDKNPRSDNSQALRSSRSAEARIRLESNWRSQFSVPANFAAANGGIGQKSPYYRLPSLPTGVTEVGGSRFRGCRSFRKRASLRPRKSSP